MSIIVGWSFLTYDVQFNPWVWKWNSELVNQDTRRMVHQEGIVFSCKRFRLWLGVERE